MIKIGSLNISSFKLGGADCSIYLRSVKLYPTEEPTPPIPLNVITYQASEKLTETTNLYGGGLHTNAFSGSSSLQLTMTSHTFENGVGTIEFDGDIASIGSYAFNYCTSLTSVTIPSSVTSIGSNTFQNCSLTSVTMPNSVTSIGSSAFRNCYNLTSVTIPSSVTSISGSAFRNCSGLTSVGVVGSGASVEIPNSVTSIGSYAFNYCTSLTSVTIPSSVTSISSNTFQNCSSLTSVTVNATTPPSLGNNAFYSTNNCPIYVPSASVETYKAASGWSTYASRIQAILA